MDLNNKVALVTGGTHGIGAETAIMLAKQGARISLVARNIDHTTIKEEIESFGQECCLIAADLSKEEACKKAVEQTIDRFGSVDILVHSAGAAAPGSLLNGAREVWYEAFDIHVHAAFHLSAAVVPNMQKKKEGVIILISSAAGLRGVKNSLAYAVVKGAIPQFARAMAFELSDANIRVNCVSPGIIRTRFQDYLTPEQIKNNTENRIPLHREGSPSDVADAIGMLIRNDFITGENIVIDGGMTMRIV
jgi:NAD(P)-dependent dehydrogenase (short-subunit alcohol dehydrogenase family)